MGSIFDEAGKVGQHKIRNSGKPLEVPFGRSKLPDKIDSIITNPASAKLKDIDEIIPRLREIHDDIEKKLEYIYEKTGLTPKYIKDYLNNPNNFNEYEWGRIQSERQALLGSLMGSTKVEEMRYKAKPTEKELEKSDRDRRGKTMGSRKNWIPLR